MLLIFFSIPPSFTPDRVRKSAEPLRKGALANSWQPINQYQFQSSAPAANAVSIFAGNNIPHRSNVGFWPLSVLPLPDLARACWPLGSTLVAGMHTPITVQLVTESARRSPSADTDRWPDAAPIWPPQPSPLRPECARRTDEPQSRHPRSGRSRTSCRHPDHATAASGYRC